MYDNSKKMSRVKSSNLRECLSSHSFKVKKQPGNSAALKVSLWDPPIICGPRLINNSVAF